MALPAQEPGHYFHFNLGASQQKLQDASLSPVRYAGFLGNVGIGYHHYAKKSISQLDLMGTIGLLYPAQERSVGGSATAIGGRFRYAYGRLLPAKEHWTWALGLSSLNIWDYRDVQQFRNNSFNFNGFLGVGPWGYGRKALQLGQQYFYIEQQMSLPIAAYVLRPAYVRPSDDGGLGYQELDWLGELFIVEMQSRLIWKISGENYLGLVYRWEYAQHNNLNLLQSAQHFIHLQLCTRL